MDCKLDWAKAALLSDFMDSRMTGQDVTDSPDHGDSPIPATGEGNRSPIQRFQYFLHTNQAAASLLVLAISVAVFAVLAGHKLFSPYALSLIVQQVTFSAIVGVAQSVVILTAGVDLSVGAIVGLSSVIMSEFVFRYGVPVPLAILSGFCFAALCGMINGLLVALIEVPAFMITLGTWLVFGAIPHIYSGGEAVRGQDIERLAPLLLIFGDSFHIGGATITLGGISMVALVLLFWYILNFTAWGRHVYAVGDDPEAAKMAGVAVTRVLVCVYTVSGIICCFAG
jgi:fructose transport system permease protein